MSKEKAFKDYLAALPKKMLADIDGGDDGERKIISVQAVMGSLLKKYADPAYLRKLIQGLGPDESALFRLLSIEGKQGATISEAVARLKRMSEERASAAFEQLQRKLLVFGVRTVPYRFFIFKEIRQLLRQDLITAITGNLRRVKTARAAITCGDSAFRDLVFLALHLLRGSLSKTKDGRLNKKHLDAIAGYFENRMDFGNYDPRAFDSLFGLIFRFLVKKSLVDEDESGLHLSSKGKTWLGSPADERCREWLGFVLAENNEDKSRLLCSVLGAAAESVHCGDLAGFFCGGEACDNGALPPFFERLRTAGLIDVCPAEKGVSGLSLSVRGAEMMAGKLPSLAQEEAITLMPNFEILVPRQLQPGPLTVLFQICDIVKSDAMLTLKLTQASLYAGLDAGAIDSGAVVALFTRLSPRGIPQNVLFSLNEWLGAYGVVSFEMHFILRVKNAELHERIKRVITGAKFQWEELPGTGFSINAADYHEVFSILSRLGLSPKPFQDTRRSAVPRDRQGTILDDYLSAAQRAERDDEFIVPEEKAEPVLAAGKINGKYGGKLKALPYHELIHVINYSILMGSGLEVELKDTGEHTTIVPRELISHVSEPRMTGHHAVSGEPLEIRIDDIAKVRVGEG